MSSWNLFVSVASSRISSRILTLDRRTDITNLNFLNHLCFGECREKPLGSCLGVFVYSGANKYKFVKQQFYGFQIWLLLRYELHVGVPRRPLPWHWLPSGLSHALGSSGLLPCEDSIAQAFIVCFGKRKGHRRLWLKYDTRSSGWRQWGIITMCHVRISPLIIGVL